MWMEKNLEAVITARTDEYEAGKSEEELVKEALEHPIGTPRLSELVKGKNRIVLVTSDHTRAVPSKLTLPLLLAEIRKGKSGRRYYDSDRYRPSPSYHRGRAAQDVWRFDRRP